MTRIDGIMNNKTHAVVISANAKNLSSLFLHLISIIIYKSLSLSLSLSLFSDLGKFGFPHSSTPQKLDPFSSPETDISSRSY